MSSIFKRVSVRDYQDKEVEDKKIELILKAAMAAPSAGNQQPWEFYVVKNKTLLQQLSSTSMYAGCAKKAAFAIVTCYRTEGLKYDAYAQIDMSVCCENILLEAAEQGLGAVWLGVAPIKERMDSVSGILNVPDTLKAFAIIPCGYPVKEIKQQDRYDKSRVHYLV
jgi:nitroreductase